MNNFKLRGLCAVGLVVSLCLFLNGCGKRDENAATATPTPEPVVSQTDPLPDVFTPAPFDEPVNTVTPEPTPAEPLKIELQYEGQTVTELSFMTTSVFQLNAVTNSGSSAFGGTWTSSDASAASVDDNGVVTCWKVGTPKITYTIGETSESCTLKITEPKVQIYYGGAVKSDISLSSTWGFEIQLTSVVSPEGSEVAWSSDNTDVATVSETGYVTARKMGNATITCKCGTAKATCIIRVLNNPPTYLAATPEPNDDTPRIVITYAGLPNSDFTLKVGESLDMDYMLYNIPQGTPVTWSVQDPDYLTVNENGVIVARKSTVGIAANRNYTTLIATCGEYKSESLVFIKDN